jgi:hypothetical protein
MTEPAPETAPEALSRIGNILADAERQVTEIVADAERQSAATHAVSRRMLEARAAELAEIAAGIAASAAAAQNYLNRLHALPPLDLPAVGAVGPDRPAPAVAPEPPTAAAVAPEPPTAAADGVGAATPESTQPDAPTPSSAAPARSLVPVADPPAAGPTEPDASTDDAEGGGSAPSAEAATPDGGDPAEHPTDESDPAQSRATFRPIGAAPTLVPDADGDEAPASANTDAHADLPIVAGSDTATGYGADPPEKVDSARLVALSMAANGRSREEVEAHVRDELGITDHAALIDYVFGISAPSSIVPSWPPRRRRR